MTTTSQPLTGRTAVITGASSGIGAATARAAVAQGARVALLARRADRLATLTADLGEDASAHPLDVTDLVALTAVARALPEADLVVANAGVMLPGEAESQPFEEWRTQLDVNVLGVLATVHAFLPGLLRRAEQGRPADFVLVSSIGAHQVFAEYAVYCATKAAVTMLSATLKAELGPRGVRVAVVEPGFTGTELQGNVTDAGHRDTLEGWFAELEPLEAADVAAAITHLAALPARVNLARVIVSPTAQP